MNQGHKFRAVAWWSSEQTGSVKSDSAPYAIHFTAPVGWGGFEGRWTPQDLLLAAIASCFTATFCDLAEGSMLEFTDLQVEAEGIAGPTGSGHHSSEIVVRATLTIPREEEQERALHLLEKARAGCPISSVLAIPPRLETVVRLCVASSVA